MGNGSVDNPLKNPHPGVSENRLLKPRPDRILRIGKRRCRHGEVSQQSTYILSPRRVPKCRDTVN